ncbi:MAG TPA: DCC1-like thiol-disulfide oxidoreductase family protein [Thermoanaerobaculia bacterium]|nr:DCC1-like thiol-disulfide oxidoreductase family protein [Thermoanaerobaculia bacterium]
MTNGWTGGQYSLWRFLFGVCLFVHFILQLADVVLRHRGVASLLFPGFVALSGFVKALPAVAIIAAVFFAIGLYDRIAAIVICCILLGTFARSPMLEQPSALFACLLLIAHALTPPAPYGSWAARSRVDPAGGWSMPPRLFAAVWIAMAIWYSYSGYTKFISLAWLDGSALARMLASSSTRFGALVLAIAPVLLLRLITWGVLGLELFFAPLALARRARPSIWLLTLAAQCALVTLVHVSDLAFGMIALHLFTFDPAWVPRIMAVERDQVFYDGTCGLCHRSVRMLVAEDRGGEAFVYAPLGGDTFAAAFDAATATTLPDSVIIKTSDGRVLIRSAGAVHVAKRLGGAWRIIGSLIGVIPLRLRDAAYDFIARIRYRLFARPKEACPILPPDLRSRFGA